MIRRLFLMTFLLLLVGAISACSSASQTASVELPDYVKHASHTVQTAYRYAVEHPEMLDHQPCYCGCGSMGHIHNLHCYVKEIKHDGTVIFDNHAAGCGICIDITLDVMRLSAEGKSQLEIRRYVDAKYSPFGPSTDTPLPEA